MGYQILEASASYPLRFQMISATDHITGAIGLTPTVMILRTMDTAFSVPQGAIRELGNGWYQVAGNAIDSSQLGPLSLHAEAPGADPCDDQYEVVAALADLVASPATTASSTGAYLDALNNALTGPAEVSGDAGSVRQFPIPDLIKAANYLAALQAANTRRLGVRYTRIIPDGTVQGPRRVFRRPWSGFPDDMGGLGWP